MRWLRRQDQQEEPVALEPDHDTEAPAATVLLDPPSGDSVDPSPGSSVDPSPGKFVDSSPGSSVDPSSEPLDPSPGEPRAPQGESSAPWTPADERRQLIDLLIYAWDRARSPGVWERLEAGLAEVGVQVLRPDGEPFDPNAHEVGGTEPTDDESKVDTVAETEVVGFADRGMVIREPVVVVYRRDGSSPGRADG